MAYMYEDTKTWNPFKGCNFDCIYCEKSFKRQAKRQKHNCIKCYNYEPHFHPERLNRIPKADLVFACGNGDIAFADKKIIKQILKTIEVHPKQTFLLQTKKPECLFNLRIPSNVIVGTTIETNRSTNKISKAPNTKIRAIDLMFFSRRAVTIEPILDFDLYILYNMIYEINPEIVWIGYANHTNGSILEEPTKEETLELIDELRKFTEVRLKTIREKL